MKSRCRHQHWALGIKKPPTKQGRYADGILRDSCDYFQVTLHVQIMFLPLSIEEQCRSVTSAPAGTRCRARLAACFEFQMDCAVVVPADTGRAVPAPSAAMTAKAKSLFIGLSRLWDLSRTPAPSPLTFGGSGHPLVSRRNSSGEKQVTSSALGFGEQQAHTKTGAKSSPHEVLPESLCSRSDSLTNIANMRCSAQPNP